MGAMQASRLNFEEAGIEASEADAMLTSAQSRRSMGKLIGAVAAMLLVGTGAWAGAHFTFQGQAMGASPKDELQQLTQIIAKPKRSACSHAKEDCFSTGCCDVVGYTCFQTKPGEGKCMKNCTPSASQLCTQPQAIMEPILQDAAPIATSLYCFAVYTKNTGTTKPSEELEILQHEYSVKQGIFACQQQDVFS